MEELTGTIFLTQEIQSATKIYKRLKRKRFQVAIQIKGDLTLKMQGC